MEEKKLTGYPSIDKPWLKYYSEEAINAPLPNCRIFDYLYTQNKGHDTEVALSYFGKDTTYGELFAKIDDTAKAFLHIGVKAGDIVSICSVTTPETIYSFYGLNKLGAISNMIDPRTSEDGIKHYLNEARSRVLLTIDVAYPKIEKILAETDIEIVIVVSAADSMPAFMKIGYRMSQKKHILVERSCSKVASWTEFISFAQNVESYSYPKYQKGMPAAIVHTGGTTGFPKGVVYSDDSYNHLLHQLKYAGLKMKRGHKFLGIMPPFIAYGLLCGIHQPLCTGSKLILIPRFESKQFGKLIRKYKPNHVWGVPTHFSHMINSKRLAKTDLSFLIRAGVGGDALNTASEVQINDFFNEHHCPHKIIKGYGMTELNSAACVCNDECNEVGSVGIPFVHTIISAFNPGTQEELQCGEIGELCVTGPSMMIGYYQNIEETDKVVQIHKDGYKWVHTGDIGYVNETGLVFIVDRIKRMIIRNDGFKVYPSIIENVIAKHPDVSACAVVGVRDTQHSQGLLPKAFVVLQKGVSQTQAQNAIEELCQKELAEYAMPIAYEWCETLPLTPVGKVDFRALEYQAERSISNGE